ncbi:MAG: serine/threonine protein kinase [Planctomycetota bacterium]|nr:serine/threonine protein kinase [Planctomycetota bacterium]
MYQTGTKIGAYTIDRIVGSGATGTVYRAVNSEGQDVALKILSSRFVQDNLVSKMFEDGARAGLQIHHPHIVRTFDVGTHDGIPFVAFEFVHGVPLADQMRRAGAMTEGQCIWVMRHMAQALRKLRMNGIVHQDIKPENILIDANGECKLSDLGFARVPLSQVNWARFSAGTPIYMSPEQALGSRGSSKVDHRSDLYSLGATIYHAITGQPPFTSKVEEEILQGHLKERPVAVNVRVPKVSMEFAKLIGRLLEKNPDHRYQTAEHLLLALRIVNTPAEAPLVVVSRVTAHGTVARVLSPIKRLFDSAKNAT